LRNKDARLVGPHPLWQEEVVSKEGRLVILLP